MPAHKGSVPHNAGKGNGWIDPRGYRIKSETVNGKRRQVREHRAVMEAHLGRRLEPWEIVHHKDGNQLNNALDNLEVMDFGAHTIEHHTGSRKSYDTRRTMEAFANMRGELKRERAINADLLAALGKLTEQVEKAFLINHPQLCQENRDENAAAYAEARAAIAKAKGEK